MDEKKRVLIIDDETLIRRALADYLTEIGYETVMASNGAEGLTIARSEKFHTVLVDLRMPQMDGMEVIATLHTEQPELPVVVVSGTGVLPRAPAHTISKGNMRFEPSPGLCVPDRNRSNACRSLQRSAGALRGPQTSTLRARRRRLNRNPSS